MHFRCLGQPAFLLAHRTERMPGKEPSTYLSPCSTVSPLGRRIPVVFLVLLTCQPLMFRAVPCIRQFRTAWVAAGLLRFSRHGVHLHMLDIDAIIFLRCEFRVQMLQCITGLLTFLLKHQEAISMGNTVIGFLSSCVSMGLTILPLLTVTAYTAASDL